jgi:hypothetical protein
MDVEITANLIGLAAGPVKVMGQAAGSVLVRNPNFFLAFSHPRTIRAGEPYEAAVTILNTSEIIANLVNVTLPPTSISGAVLESDDTVQLGDIAPGETRTAVYQLRAQRTGSISFTQLTSDEDITGRFRLRMGVDERGVALSPDAIGFPSFVDDLPQSIIDAATRVLGQALSVATAGQVPPGVRRVFTSTITQRVIELAEAGQRVRYGDPMPRVLSDLLLDWQGARRLDPGFDQIMRETEAGREFRETLMAEMENADGLNAVARLTGRVADAAGRGESWWFMAGSDGALLPALESGDEAATLVSSEIQQAMGYRGTAGHLIVAAPTEGSVFRWDADAPVAAADLSVVMVETDGSGTQYDWNVLSIPAGACFTYDSSSVDGLLSVDLECDGVVDSQLAALEMPVTELEPQVIAVLQDISVHAGRPNPSCLPPGEYKNYGTVVAVLFSKPMGQDDINAPDAYVLDNGIAANSVRVQPGGRVALLNLKAGVGTLRSRDLSIGAFTDPRGNLLSPVTIAVQTEADDGTTVRGRVARSDGSPARNVPVTLTMLDEIQTNIDCSPFVVRVSQVFTDDTGFFDFDFVMAGVPYSLSATDTGGLSQEAIDLILEAVAGDTLAREKLLELADRPEAQGTFLETLEVDSLPEAIALTEGLDRAVLNDFAELGSARIGTEVVVALRFRGGVRWEAPS